MEQVKTRVEARYTSHNMKANKSVDLTFKCPYVELKNYIQTIQMLNENVEVVVKIGKDKPIKLGTFTINGLNIDRDGEGTLKLNSLIDFVNASAINELPARNDEPLKIMLKCEIDLSDGEEDE